jgi:hypothetical protein
VRRLAGKFEWGADGRTQAVDSLEQGSQGGADVNGERKTSQGVLAGNGSQENGAPGKHMVGLGWAQSSLSWFSMLEEWELSGASFSIRDFVFGKSGFCFWEFEDRLETFRCLG